METLNLKRAFQALFLSIFIILTAMGKIQLWMAIFLGSTIAAFFWGRFYCGWICPINTLIEPINYINKKFGIRRREAPGWIKHPLVRYAILSLFLGFMVFTFSTGIKIPILIILAAAGTFISLFYVPALWHRYLCPYGVLLSITSSSAKYRFYVKDNNCVKCGICESVCDGYAVQMENKQDYPVIDKKLCLQCLKCVHVCPKESIKYTA